MSRGSSIGRPNNTVCEKCGKGFERTETISEHEALKMKCPKYGSKKVSFVPGNVYGGPKVKHGRLTLTVAAFGLAPRLSRVTDSVQAGQDSR